MHVQPDLFNDPPIARKSDPVTSKIAAVRYSKSTRKTDCDVMFQLIREFPAKTPGEYAEILMNRGVKPLKAHQITSKRISDIKATMLVKGIKRVCSVSGHLAQTYYVREDHL